MSARTDEVLRAYEALEVNLRDSFTEEDVYLETLLDQLGHAIYNL